jgi:peptide/nickel transport system permease protein
VIEFVLRRLVHSLFAFAGLLALVFFLTRLTGDPSYLYLPQNADATARAAFSAQHGFDDPVVVQFVRYVGNLLHFDFGISLRQHRSAMDIALEAFPTTLKLAGERTDFGLPTAVLSPRVGRNRRNDQVDQGIKVGIGSTTHAARTGADGYRRIGRAAWTRR